MPRFEQESAKRSKNFWAEALDAIGLICLAQLRVEPSSGERPAAVGRPQGYPQNRGRLLQGQTGETAEFQQLGRLWILAGEPVEGFVEGKHLFSRVIDGNFKPIHVNSLSVATTFESSLVASPVNQNPSHGLGRGGKQMSPVLPLLDLLDVDQPQVDLMDQGRSLEGLAGLFMGQFLGGQPAEFVIDKREKLLGRLRVAFLNGTEDASDFMHKDTPKNSTQFSQVLFASRP